jgi:hypothetical protein
VKLNIELLDKRAELAARRDTLKADLAKLDDDLLALDRVLTLFDPTIDQRPASGLEGLAPVSAAVRSRKVSSEPLGAPASRSRSPSAPRRPKSRSSGLAEPSHHGSLSITMA